ncbi:MAG: hypothetical protein ACE19N_00495 [Candidatus Karelsulcia muelleri]
MKEENVEQILKNVYYSTKIVFISKNAQKHIVLPEGEEERIIIAA